MALQWGLISLDQDLVSGDFAKMEFLDGLFRGLLVMEGDVRKGIGFNIFELFLHQADGLDRTKPRHEFGDLGLLDPIRQVLDNDVAIITDPRWGLETHLLQWSSDWLLLILFVMPIFRIVTWLHEDDVFLDAEL